MKKYDEFIKESNDESDYTLNQKKSVVSFFEEALKSLKKWILFSKKVK
jgi:hypothetical protein